MWLHQRGRSDEAVDRARRGRAALEPGDAEVARRPRHRARGARRGDGGARPPRGGAFALAPQSAHAHSNLGNALAARRPARRRGGAVSRGRAAGTRATPTRTTTSPTCSPSRADIDEALDQLSRRDRRRSRLRRRALQLAVVLASAGGTRTSALAEFAATVALDSRPRRSATRPRRGARRARRRRGRRDPAPRRGRAPPAATGRGAVPARPPPSPPPDASTRRSRPTGARSRSGPTSPTSTTTSASRSRAAATRPAPSASSVRPCVGQVALAAERQHFECCHCIAHDMAILLPLPCVSSRSTAANASIRWLTSAAA